MLKLCCKFSREMQILRKIHLTKYGQKEKDRVNALRSRFTNCPNMSDQDTKSCKLHAARSVVLSVQTHVHVCTQIRACTQRDYLIGILTAASSRTGKERRQLPVAPADCLALLIRTKVALSWRVHINRNNICTERSLDGRRQWQRDGAAAKIRDGGINEPDSH